MAGHGRAGWEGFRVESRRDGELVAKRGKFDKVLE